VKGYELIAHLHRGHAYDVYDAWSHERGCRVVLLTLRPDRRRGGRALVREGRLLQRLAHPHLVRAYEVRRRPPLVVLETLGGSTLAALLEDGPLEPEDAIQLGLQLSSAVRYLHRRGWLHLDLKPSNLIADGGRLKVIDLSIAQRPGRIRAGTGTERYMAPEQERGDRVGPPADVWGIGAVLREAGGPDDLVAACLRADPRERPAVDDLIGWLNRCGVPSASPPHPQPAA
jgi:eukaryotic-like serine/threonine-protein kinase